MTNNNIKRVSLPLSDSLFDFEKLDEVSLRWLRDVLAIIDDLHIEAVLDFYIIHIGAVTYYLINGIRLPEMDNQILALGNLTNLIDFRADDIFFFAKGSPCYFVDCLKFDALDKIAIYKKFHTGYDIFKN